MVTIKEVTTDLWRDRIVAFDARLDPEWICDVGASTPHPRASTVRAFLRRERSMVAVAVEGTEVVGYVIADDDSSGRGGCRVRWLSVSPQPDVDVALVTQGLLDVLCDKYGWAWGRVINPLIQEATVSFGAAMLREDPTLYTYRKNI